MSLGKLRYASKHMAVKFFSETKKRSINWMCRQLEIPRAAYYKWLHREIPERELENVHSLELHFRYLTCLFDRGHIKKRQVSRKLTSKTGRTFRGDFRTRADSITDNRAGLNGGSKKFPYFSSLI